MPTKLLIMDDEASIVDYTKRLFQKRGYEAFGVSTAEEAIETFRRERPQICLLDIILDCSEINGIDVLRRIKEIDSNAVCVMVTQKSDEENIAKAKEYGASQYLIKPLSIEDLIRTIENASSAARGEGEGEADG